MMFKDDYCVIDAETTVRSPIAMPAHFAWPDNHIVLFGYKHGEVTALRGPFVRPDGSLETSTIAQTVFKDGVVSKHPMLVGHNIKFDLLYMLKEGWITPKQLFECTVWDTQVVEYLLSGQTKTYPTLDSLAVKYGGDGKDDSISAMWDAGIQTECMPMEKLKPYLEGDLNNTDLSFCTQRIKVNDWGMGNLVKTQMDALIAITLMEYAGMKVDKEYIYATSETLHEKVIALEKTLLSSIVFPADYGDWSLNSTQDMGRYFFGGKYKVPVEVVVGRYKNGKDKYATRIDVKDMEGICSARPPEFYGSESTKLGWKLDESVLRNIAEKTGSVTAHKLHELRVVHKQRETYYENLKGLTFPSTFIHANINMVSTKTGRLSCNKPNIQNQTEAAGIKKAYTSRWGKEGVLLEFDYQQLEMAGLAVVSGDAQLIEDINVGRDMHTELYREMYGRSPTKEERKKFKSLSFGLVYGAGSKTLAENAGCSVADAKKFINVFYARYTGVKDFHDAIQAEAKAGRKLTKEHTPKGLPVGMFLKRMPSGRMYVYKEYDNDWKGGTSFSPTELKNWMVQGFATGDIVPMAVGVLCRTIYMNDLQEDMKPVMTVHDSILLDVKVKSLDKAQKLCYNVLSRTTEMVESLLHVDMPVNLSVGSSAGVTWGDMVEMAPPK